MENISDKQLNMLLEIVYDLDSISITVANELKKPNIERNYVLEDIYHSIYHVSSNHLYDFDFCKLIMFIYVIGIEKVCLSWIIYYT